jgi:uncharacterized protein (UPF0276 family)
MEIPERVFSHAEYLEAVMEHAKQISEMQDRLDLQIRLNNAQAKLITVLKNQLKKYEK